jgi:hypothetical protein
MAGEGNIKTGHAEEWTMLTVDQAFKLLESWTATLSNHTSLAKDTVQNVLSGITTLPTTYPSREAFAMAAFRDHFGKMADDCQEIAGAVQELRKAVEGLAGPANAGGTTM